jgi:hypothetical protein
MLHEMFILPIVLGTIYYIKRVVFDVVVKYLFNNINVNEYSMSETIDKFIIEHNGTNKHITLGTSVKTPLNTWHLVLLQDKCNTLMDLCTAYFTFNFIIFVRTQNSKFTGNVGLYDIYGSDKNIEMIIKLLESDVKPTVNPKKINSTLAFYYDDSSYSNGLLLLKEYLPSSIERVGQGKVLDSMFDNLMKRINDDRINLSVLVHGTPGVGKSNIAAYFAARISTIDKFNTLKPVIIYDYDIIHAKKLFLLIHRYASSHVFILLLNEIDVVFDEATERKVENNTAITILNDKSLMKENDKPVDNKIKINNFFDKLEKTENLIVVANTNLDYDTLREKYPTFIRKGRINHKYTIDHDTFIEHIE